MEPMTILVQSVRRDRTRVYARVLAQTQDAKTEIALSLNSPLGQPMATLRHLAYDQALRYLDPA